MGIFERVRSFMPDMHDLLLYGGLAGLFYGLHGYDPRIAWIVISSILILVALHGLGILPSHPTALPPEKS